MEPGTIEIRAGKENMNVTVIHHFLSNESYWAKGISYPVVDHSLDNSFCVGAFIGDMQVGFGRVITDYYTFGWFADFFVLDEYRGSGISKQMLSYIFSQAWSRRLRRMMLNTSSAHGLYRQFNFTDLSNPGYLQELYRPDVHLHFQ